MSKTIHSWRALPWTCWTIALVFASVALAAGLPAVQSVELRNGVQVVLAPDPRATSVDLAVWYPAGTITESAGRSGTTNLLSQLMFLGSEHVARGAHIERIRVEGGRVNSQVNADYSTFFETIPPEALDLAIELEADRMRGLTFRDDDVEAVRERVRAYYRSVRASGTSGLALERLYALAFSGHPYAWPVSGLEEDLGRITPRELRAYHRARFAPDGAVVTVVGRFEPEATLATLRQRFEAVPRRGVRSANPPKLPTAPKERHATGAVGASPMVMVGWRGPGATEVEPVTLELLAQMLVSGSHSRLLGTPIAPGVTARGELDVRRLASLLYCSAMLAPDADTSGIEAAIVERIEGLVGRGFSEQELARAKKRLEAATLSAAQTTRGRAQQLGLATVRTGQPVSVDQRVRTIRATTTATVEAAARGWLNPEQRYVVWLTSEPGEAGGSEP